MTSLPEFTKAVEKAINCASMENGSDTPDFILADFLTDCLLAFNKATRARGQWYGAAAPQPPAPEQTCIHWHEPGTCPICDQQREPAPNESTDKLCPRCFGIMPRHAEKCPYNDSAVDPAPGDTSQELIERFKERAEDLIADVTAALTTQAARIAELEQSVVAAECGYAEEALAHKIYRNKAEAQLAEDKPEIAELIEQLRAKIGAPLSWATFKAIEKTAK